MSIESKSGRPSLVEKIFILFPRISGDNNSLCTRIWSSIGFSKLSNKWIKILNLIGIKQLKINDGLLNYWDSKGKNIIARQQLNPVYHRNGVGYIISRECLVKKNSIKGNKTGFLLVKTPQISIDTLEDLKKAEMIKKF